MTVFFLSKLWFLNSYFLLNFPCQRSGGSGRVFSSFSVKVSTISQLSMIFADLS